MWKHPILGSCTKCPQNLAVSQQGMAKSEAKWKEELSESEYAVLRLKATEPEGSGEYHSFFPKAGEGYFSCRGCGNPLYSAEAKFKAIGCGWPSFDKCYTGSIDTAVDRTGGMHRIEITCRACGGHLGHVFKGEKMCAAERALHHARLSSSLSLLCARVYAHVRVLNACPAAAGRPRMSATASTRCR